MSKKAFEVIIKGIVQGVGFRPFIYTLAKSLSLHGEVWNQGADVIIFVEGTQEQMDRFLTELKRNPPALARIKSLEAKPAKWHGYSDFTIEASSSSEDSKVYISPDVGVCKACERELLDPADRRYQYPFINCTNCGPRFTIIKGVPYDRPLTTMAKFEMCEQCDKEYRNPGDRRYHAQPISCYHCGPQLRLLDREGNGIPGPDIIELTRQFITAGKIIAVKGLGGYHLVCDARNAEAVASLRKRKIRDDKPFAVMIKDSGAVLQYCHMNRAEKELLESERKPIVLLRKKQDFNLPEELAPGNPYLGVLLPYTPVHRLLFHNSPLTALVATSGNRSSEPIYYRDEEAFDNLKTIADYFLVNDRDIHIRTDDSVTRVFQGREYILRRARGYAPSPITCEIFGGETVPQVLACGGELKNTFCLNRDQEFYLSQHIGDLENAETLASFEEGIAHFNQMFEIRPEIVAYDLHPEYLSTKYAMELNLPMKLPVQHHHAHIASCMAENEVTGEVIGVAFDGTGYGEDGNLWGGEFFVGGYQGFQRAAHLEYVKMPGGEQAVKEPWRMAVSYLWSADRQWVEEAIRQGLFSDVEAARIKIVLQMLDRNINSPLTSSMGRLFDAVSALLGIRSRISYEGQAAIELEYIAVGGSAGVYSPDYHREGDRLVIRFKPVIQGILMDLKQGVPASVISEKFHATVAQMVVQVCCRIREKTGLSRVALSGGVFQNMTLLGKCSAALQEKAFTVYTHSLVPANDGGLSLGQAVMAAAKWAKRAE